MKKLMRTFALMAVAALGLSACTGEKLVPDNGNADGKFVTVHFGAEAAIEGATKATLTTEDEKKFKSAWENGDALSVKYSFDYGATKETTATWSADKSCFEAQMEGGKGNRIYDALYPAPNAEKKVDFGSARTQNGSAYNSKYDLMKGSAAAEGVDAGMTEDGKKIVFEMTRQTAIAYFHLTSTLNEEVVSAKLSVEGATAYLSTSEVKANEDYAKGYAFTKTEGVASKEINLTFDAGPSPKTSDFKLWFNVLPTDYDKMTLTVETANHTLTISRNATGKYEAGKLYKVVKTISADKWVEKGGETPAQTSWIATDLADITATDEVVITMAKGESVYAMTSDNGEKNPSAVAVAVKNGELTAAPADNLVWNIANDKGNLTIYPNGQTDKWLFAVSGDTKVKVGNSTTNKIFTLDATKKYLKNTGANRYLGVYNNADWRCYTSTSTNIGGQTLCFYVKGGPIDNTRPTLSVDQNSKVWAADATDAFVVKVTVNSEGGDWTVTPKTLSWATVAVDKAAGTITVTPNRANETKTANEATLTVTHASDASLTKEISLKQNGVGGETAKTYTLTFANSYGDTGTNNYTTSWEATRDGFTWKMVNWNNNNYNNNWSYVKAGPKGNTNAHAKIETADAMPEAISKISITIDKIDNGSIPSIVLKSSTTEDFTSGTTIETKSSVTNGEVVFTIPSPQNNLYYQIDFTLKNTTGKNGKNGVATVSKVVYTNN
jgi:hypothetical protein